jgi:DNA repair protein RadC
VKQVILDKSRENFLSLFSKFTGISIERLGDYLEGEKHTIEDIFHRPQQIARTEKEIMAIHDLREMRNIYNGLKTFSRGVSVNGPGEAYHCFESAVRDMASESYSSVLFLNSRNQVLDDRTSNISFEYEDIPGILKEALLKNARSIMLCHNHPSGSPNPSRQDYHFTSQLWRAGWFLGIKVLDHLVVCNGGFVSLLERTGKEDFRQAGEARLPLQIYESEQISFDMSHSSSSEVVTVVAEGKEKERFIDLFNKYTGISIDRLTEYLDKHNVVDLLQRPTAISTNQKELAAIEDLREMRNMYDVLEGLQRNDVIISPGGIALNYFRATLMDIQDREYLNVMFFDENQVLGITRTEGTIDQQYVFPREVMKEAVLKNASSIVLCHNHPSGDPTPSTQDIILTQRMYAAGRVVGINVFDHFVVANEQFQSLRLVTKSNDFGFATSALRDRVETGNVVQEGIRGRIAEAVTRVRANKENEQENESLIR